MKETIDHATINSLMARIQGLTDEEKAELLEFINSRFSTAKER